jgi:hypothetical protein
LSWLVDAAGTAESVSTTINFDVGDKTPVRPVTLRDITAP